jgi:carbonic anhydrase
MISAQEALERLQSGNARFVAHHPSQQIQSSDEDRAQSTFGQAPFAIILGCSDSRVPVEIIFDQGAGDLFVIRVAGNIVGPTVIGSIEFAAATLGTKLVVVLGHTQCGAITTAIEELQKPTEDLSPSLQSIVDRIRPAIEDCVDDPDLTGEAMSNEALRENVKASVRKLQENSPIISELVDNGSLHIVGAEYAILSGLVQFMDGVPLTTHPRK